MSLFGALSLASSDSSRAACTCVCVDGLNRPLCASITDRRPVCPPKVCPREPPLARPIEQPKLPPADADSCSRKYIYNRYSQRYEWWQLCR